MLTIFHAPRPAGAQASSPECTYLCSIGHPTHDEGPLSQYTPEQEQETNDRNRQLLWRNQQWQTNHEQHDGSSWLEESELLDSLFIAGVTFGAANLLWSPRGDRLALNLGTAIWVFEPTHQGEVPLFVDSSTNTTRGGSLAWFPDSTRLAQIAPLSVWDIENHRRLPTSFDNPNDSVGETLNYDALAWDADGKQVKAVSYSSSEVTWTVL